MNRVDKSAILKFILVVALALCAGCGSDGDRVMDQSREMPPKSIKAVLEEHSDEWMKIPGVVGTGIGELNERPCISIYVDKKSDALTSKFPPSVDGHPVNVEVIGEIGAL